MGFLTFLRRNRDRLTTRPGGARRQVGHARVVRLRLENLEDRCLLAYTITELGSFGGLYTYAYGLNNLGQVVGQSQIAPYGYTHAFLSQNGNMTDLGTLWATNGVATGINNEGQVVGFVYSSDQTHAFLYEHQRMKDLGTLGGQNSEANAINDMGQVAGWSLMPNYAIHAFVYQNGELADLHLRDALAARANAINNFGQMAGWGYINGTNIYHALRFDHGTVTDIGTLGGVYSVATGINAAGEVIGYSNYIGGQGTDWRPFFYHQHRLTDLGTLGGTWSYARGINSQGWVVGESTTASGPFHAFLERDGQMVDLNTLVPPQSGWTLTNATAINDNGAIVGDGTDPSGHQAAFLLTPFGTDDLSLLPTQVEAVLGLPASTSAGGGNDGLTLADNTVQELQWLPAPPQTALDFAVEQPVPSEPAFALPVPPRQAGDLGVAADLMPSIRAAWVDG